MAKNTDKKVADGPLGSPRGKHSEPMAKTGDCHCGRCTNKALGWPKPVVVTFS